MVEAGEYEERISKALARIAAAVERQRALPPPELPPDIESRGDEGELAALQAECARLQEESQGLTRDNARLAAEHEAARARLADMEEALQSLRATQAGLAETVAELRAALAGQVDVQTDGPGLVNRAMRAEIEAAAAQRQADAAEIDAIIGELAPLISQEERDAPG